MIKVEIHSFKKELVWLLMKISRDRKGRKCKQDMVEDLGQKAWVEAMSNRNNFKSYLATRPSIKSQSPK